MRRGIINTRAEKDEVRKLVMRVFTPNPFPREIHNSLGSATSATLLPLRHPWKRSLSKHEVSKTKSSGARFDPPTGYTARASPFSKKKSKAARTMAVRDKEKMESTERWKMLRREEKKTTKRRKRLGRHPVTRRLAARGETGHRHRGEAALFMLFRGNPSAVITGGVIHLPASGSFQDTPASNRL